MVRGLRQLTDYLGESIRIHLKQGGAFYFKVTGATRTHLTGYDDEGMNLKVDIADIDFIVG